MNITVNPFQQLYFSDDAQTDGAFVDLFSSAVLQTAIHPVFQGGNVVLSGTQGCGKTMILTLLRPETRIAYHQRRVEFPVHHEMRRFISAGVNLTRSKITDIVQVTLDRGDEVDERELPFYFADFFNYWVVGDLLKSIRTVGESPEVFEDLVNLRCMDKFVASIVAQDCWFGALAGAETLDELARRISDRILFYRKWVNGNYGERELPEEMQRTKTNIGEPIARVAECLREARVIPNDVPVLIRVDQIEELHKAFNERPRRLLLSFRKLLNRSFAARDARVHYRIGTRRYGWNRRDFLSIWGSDARLENRRDYNLIDMDAELFALGENKNSIFDKFAQDAFQKRVAHYFSVPNNQLAPGLAKIVFQKSPAPEERIGTLSHEANDAQVDRALALDAAADGGIWTKEWKDFLRALFREDRAGMLNAVLAAAWGRQTGGGRSTIQHRVQPPPKDAPWRDRKWWRKERLDQAVLQLMTRCQQRFMWWGYEDIRSLSGGNITVFLHVCHRTWDGFLKSESNKLERDRIDLLNGGTISRNIQAAGILFASNEWFNKLPEEPQGDSRMSFVAQLGMRLNREMLSDIRMAYPGGNGISIPPEQTVSGDTSEIALRDFLDEAVGYGVLIEVEHTSKSKSEGHRRKYYLNPILCPRFQLPEARTKEPYYWTFDQLLDLARKAEINVGYQAKSLREEPASVPMFPEWDARGE